MLGNSLMEQGNPGGITGRRPSDFNLESLWDAFHGETLPIKKGNPLTQACTLVAMNWSGVIGLGALARMGQLTALKSLYTSLLHVD